MLVRSGLSGTGCAQFHAHAPQWTHFSRLNNGAIGVCLKTTFRRFP
jgi:N-acetyl-anhydromuramyl-L-alanine amidase AmpD